MAFITDCDSIAPIPMMGQIDIIRKCIEIPGVSIKRSEFNAELLMKTKEGKGSMTFFQLFPGLTIAYIFINSPTWAAPNLGEDSFIKKGPLLLNYCVTGRCEIILNNGNFVYVKDGDISLTECFAQKQYVYPRRIYEGMELFVDTNTLATESTWIQKEFGNRSCVNFCPLPSSQICSTFRTQVFSLLLGSSGSMGFIRRTSKPILRPSLVTQSILSTDASSTHDLRHLSYT